ncbi:hypothetical protein PPL_11104 [Heterostelium album PN500]|uniref:Uncharacterized protein n=1 Tax=Heterostelium pallidum (strain ATCC 26659 / Pp 5 / PN500) TaxID=670386 RepID=D3BSY4_HETP5|nr:hypothetical protein PPL_11104 [Heterostelium album PN500]EFA75599.1 hypothetical protein PPL_11104 [Heterostelium album PN500]|eukprot:XP_020427733.1 hypothetical protein PPL_11104 [Heterostelium album PN500]
MIISLLRLILFILSLLLIIITTTNAKIQDTECLPTCFQGSSEFKEYCGTSNVCYSIYLEDIHLGCENIII